MNVSDLLKKYRPSLTDGERARLERVSALLKERNKAVNLTAITDDAGIALLHMIDSLALLDTGLFTPGVSVIDVGCGGGFPSLPLAICAPDCAVTANDATLKKLDFVRDAAAEASADNLTTLYGRAEELSLRREHREKYDVAVSRGVARMNLLCEWCLPFVTVGGHFVAMKGERGEEEAFEAENAIKTLGGRLVDIINYTIPEYGYLHRLIIIEKLFKTPDEYPRANGKMRKNPL